jgi:hypothetical protein
MAMDFPDSRGQFTIVDSGGWPRCGDLGMLGLRLHSFTLPSSTDSH